jgi:hypothetical protein
MIKIVKGKKIPARGGGYSTGRGNIKYPFGDMKKGDAFSVPAKLKDSVETCLRRYNIVNKKKMRLVRRNEGNKTWFWRA